jgi:uncharacterized protein (TIGR00725 family)
MPLPIIGVMGSAAPTPALHDAAYQLGVLLARAGFVVLTGGRPVGVMDAAMAGAKTIPSSLTLGILPGSRGDGVSVHTDLAIFTGLGDARNAINALTPAAIVACGLESPGTVSEVALALKAHRPVILLQASPAAVTFFRAVAGSNPLHVVETPEAALQILEGLELRNAG